METKRCFKCQVTQPLSEFYAHPMMGDGLLGKCKACAKRDVRANYRAKRQRYSEYERKRNRTPKRRAYKRKRERLYRDREPQKYKARQAVGNAIRDKRLFRRPCEKQPCNSKAQAHHEDYSKPLEVIWLCFKHHRAEHGQLVN